MDWKAAGDSGSWVAQEGGTRSKGCDKFVAQQDEMAAQIVNNGGYYLDLKGRLQRLNDGSVPSRFSGRSLVYGDWDSKGSGFAINSGTGELVAGRDGNGYRVRADGWKTSSGFHLAIYPDGATWTIPEGTQNGRFGGPQSWHGISYRRGSAVVTRVARPVGGVVSGGYLPNVPGLCPARFHPRGEDSVERIGSHTGRTLTGLTHARGKIADQYWCRSDLRFARAFETQNHGVALHRAAEGMTGAFQSYGRLNCYYTAFSVSSHASYTDGIRPASSGGMVCSYLFPIPQCDPDTDNGSDSDWRDYMAEELEDIADDLGPSKFNKDDGEACPEATPAQPDPQDPTPRNAASFSDPACVTANLSIYENRTVGSAAEPGVPALDRTLAVAADRTAWDMDITSPHHATASPPRRNGDATGCADGSERRAYHSTLPGHPLRKQSPAPSYAASDRTDTAAPPNDADGDIDYSGAVKNMAHRYASRVAENTCAVKLAEAEAEISLLEVREDAFAQWLSDYKTAADTNASRYSSYRRTPQQSGSGLAVLRFNDAEANKATYAALLATRYTNLSSALSAAKTAYDTATDRTVGSSRAAVIAGGNSGCVSHYDSEITRLKTLFSSAEASALGNGAAGIREEQTFVVQTRLAATSAPVLTTVTNAYAVPSLSAIRTRSYRAAYCSSGRWFLGIPGTSCSTPRPCREGEERGIFGCADPGTMVPAQPALYRCPRRSYTVSGTVSGTYGTASRSGSFSATYVAPARGNSTSSSCPSFAVQTGATYAADAAAYVRGTPGTASSLPSVASASAPATLRTLSKTSLLGSYYPSHGDRANLEATAASDRNAAGGSLSVSVGSVPSGSPQKVEDYQTAYKRAYDTAFSQAEGHMSGTAWDSFDWRYHSPSLAWGNYQEDPTTTYSASTATPRDGTGCDLISIASDGTVTVEATRLDYEGTSGSPPSSSRYGVGNTISTRTDAQRTCKILRTRTPELLLEYQPSRPSGTDASKAVSSFYVNYQPTVAAGQPPAERFKLHDEAEVFAVKTSLADSSPVLCYQPGEALVAHVAAKGIDAVNKAVFRHASGFAGGNKKHCYRHPSAAQLGTPPKPSPQPAFAFFDDTAHSAMASVNVVWQQPNPRSP